MTLILNDGCRHENTNSPTIPILKCIYFYGHTLQSQIAVLEPNKSINKEDCRQMSRREDEPDTAAEAENNEVEERPPRKKGKVCRTGLKLLFGCKICASMHTRANLCSSSSIYYAAFMDFNSRILLCESGDPD